MVCFLTGYASCAASASLPAWLAHLLSAVSAASACERTALNCNKTSVFSRVQARSAPRAHVRELLCVSQSSKERLRRSRTESSGAAPAIEELAGEARQVRPAGPRADQYQPGSDFSRAKRSGGRPALRLPRATFSHRRSPCRLHTDYALQKSEFPASALSSPIEEVRRATGPPATTGNIFSQKITLPPPYRLRTTEVEISRLGTVFSHRRGPEGDRPSGYNHYFLSKVLHFASTPFTYHTEVGFSRQQQF